MMVPSVPVKLNDRTVDCCGPANEGVAGIAPVRVTRAHLFEPPNMTL